MRYQIDLTVSTVMPANMVTLTCQVPLRHKINQSLEKNSRCQRAQFTLQTQYEAALPVSLSHQGSWMKIWSYWRNDSYIQLQGGFSILKSESFNTPVLSPLLSTLCQRLKGSGHGI
jgi:hypothetical protein